MCVVMLYTDAVVGDGKNVHVGVELLKPFDPVEVPVGLYEIDVVVDTVSLGFAASVAVQVNDVT